MLKHASAGKVAQSEQEGRQNEKVKKLRQKTGGSCVSGRGINCLWWKMKMQERVQRQIQIAQCLMTCISYNYTLVHICCILRASLLILQQLSQDNIHILFINEGFLSSRDVYILINMSA